MSFLFASDAERLRRHEESLYLEQFVGFLEYQYNFSDWMRGGYWKRGFRGPTSAFYDRHGGNFRDRLKYRREPWHEKKPENPKAAWREHKQFKRDKARCGWCRTGNAGSFNKRQVARANRQHARRAIRRDRDETCTNAVQDVVREWWD